MEDNKKINESENNELNPKDNQQENRMNIEKEYSPQNNPQDEEKDKNDSDSNESISLEENENKKTLIGNKEYDEDTLNRITIVRLTQKGVSKSEIKKILGVSRALVSKWANYQKKSQNQWVDLQNFRKSKKNLFIKQQKGK